MMIESNVRDSVSWLEPRKSLTEEVLIYKF